MANATGYAPVDQIQLMVGDNQKHLRDPISSLNPALTSLKNHTFRVRDNEVWSF